MSQGKAAAWRNTRNTINKKHYLLTQLAFVRNCQRLFGRAPDRRQTASDCPAHSVPLGKAWTSQPPSQSQALSDDTRAGHSKSRTSVSFDLTCLNTVSNMVLKCKLAVRCFSLYLAKRQGSKFLNWFSLLFSDYLIHVYEFTPLSHSWRTPSFPSKPSSPFLCHFVFFWPAELVGWGFFYCFFKIYFMCLSVLLTCPRTT